MLSYQEFTTAVRQGLPRFAANWLNAEQDAAVAAGPQPPRFIVAGPGAGKTTVLALRVLKLILVDGMRPEFIIATTFTRKAAAELRSRVLSWGYAVITQSILTAQTVGNTGRVQWLSGLDINKIAVGTLDSLAEDLLAQHRQPGAIPPATIESFLARGLIRRHVFFANNRFRDADLQNHLNAITPILRFLWRISFQRR